MKIINNLTIKSLLLLVCCVLFTIEVEASQIIFVDDVNDEAPELPIDGFAGIALATGAFIGLRKKFKKTQ